VLGLVGDNGAGKSTLMKIITGVYTADAGSIVFDGATINERTPSDRRGLGIEMIYQDLALARQLDVASNIYLGRESLRRFMGLPLFVDKQRMDREAAVIIERLGGAPAIDRSCRWRFFRWSAADRRDSACPDLQPETRNHGRTHRGAGCA